MGSFNIDVDFDDIIGSMSKYDRKQFFKEMQDEGYISEFCEITNDGEVKALSHIEKRGIVDSNDEFNQALQKLYGNGWKLTKEQEEFIINLAKRF
jgi:hypothetical protein